MISSNIHLHWSRIEPGARFRTGVSLHSHTLHSRESLNFIDKAAERLPLLAAAMRYGERRYRRVHGTALDLSRGWWTPPLGPHEAWTVESAQIHRMDLTPIVSLTDHDNIDAPVSLQILEDCRTQPISFEWTVPFDPTFFHLGVHNLPATHARRLFDEMRDYTGSPRPARLPEILREVSRIPGVLMILNHPLWDEKGIGQARHTQAARAFMRSFSEAVHALELNGLRPWRENRDVIDVASAVGKPVISGGDRHAIEPNAMLNLTNTSNFAEFADEVRSGWSDVLIMSHYRESHGWRIAHNMIDVLRTYEQHTNGWKLWSDRVFYEGDDGEVRALTELFRAGNPAPVAMFLGALQLAAAPHVRHMLRKAFATGEGVAL
jgi:hypothetical protein